MRRLLCLALPSVDLRRENYNSLKLKCKQINGQIEYLALGGEGGSCGFGALGLGGGFLSKQDVKNFTCNSFYIILSIKRE